MTSFKESTSRPMSQAAPPSRHTNGRHHSHSISLGALNLNHRVTRRKSMTSSAANNVAAAVAAAIGESGSVPSIPTTSHHRRGLGSRRGLESTSMGASSAFGSYISRNSVNDTTGRKASPTSTGDNAVGDETSMGKPISTKNRSRRASEGSHLVKAEGGKRVMSELRCDRCGKGYKHSSCLTKHMWEHDPAWAVTSKLLISKHQQVQLLEAATVLVGMNVDSPDPSEQPRTGDSDRSSASPTASGMSELRDGMSSTETTPPPTGEDVSFMAKLGGAHHYGINNSSAFSRSFQSIPSSSFTGSAPSFSPARSHFRQSSSDTRPSTADTGTLDDDEAGLAAAIELCNFGTPRTGPVAMSPDIPPVPPLPARFLSQSVSSFDALASVARTEASSTPTLFNPITMHQPLSYKVSDERDVRMDDADTTTSTTRRSKQARHSPEDVDFSSTVVPMDDDDDGVFGRMEE
ncbi:hypothetical protein AJ80_09908 [Polytolypa hystricis UAMH7299]|uniref:C2H2-type domain-containing protein n=1 Tax=Polytolypa hystricis (strain UAMH7299) TaxID=1447883 RepID=A0A2B7WH61_POLH7|nr:hypothetical protein AJ80_09908 [Polytolypa hystricis UAMH7299]